MIRGLVKTVADEFSGERAKDYVAGIIQYHRIQASPGYRRAAEYVASLLGEFGVESTIRKFRADGKKYYWTYRSFPAWEATDATLDLVFPETRRLCDFAEIKTALIQRSAPTRPVEAELVVLEDGEELADYKGKNVRGKIVLTKGNPNRVFALAVGRFGALGLVSDLIWNAPPVRGRYDLPDVRQYMGVFGDTDRLRSFGFVISVKEGEKLRQLVRDQAKLGKKVKVRAEVKARLYAGEFDVVDAFIPGRTEDEVLLVAHLCHAQPSANDNASGSACLLETARVLAGLVKRGTLPRPKRGIRFLWVPEFSGTFAYLASCPDVTKRAIAGLNLDMVGQNQELCGSSMLIESPPWAMPSCTAELLRRIRDEILPEASTHGGQGGYPLFRYADTPYSGGSDHAVLSDPTVGIPSPMIIQWPDRYYHTSDDTLDKVDPKSLKRAGTLAAAYACFLADAGKRAAKWLGEEVVARTRVELIQNCRAKLSQLTEEEGIDLAAICRFESRMDIWLEQKLEALETLTRLGDVGPEIPALKKELRASFDQELGKFSIACPYDRNDSNLDGPNGKWEQLAGRMIPIRLYTGPVQLGGALQEQDFVTREWFHGFSRQHPKAVGLYADLAVLWCDGRRTLLEVADSVEAETGARDVEGLVTYFKFLKRLKLIGLERT